MALDDSPAPRDPALSDETLGTFDVPTDDQSDESLTAVFVDEHDRILSPEELASAKGVVRWEICSLRPMNPDAKRLHDEGRAAGARGDYDAALSLLTRAAEADPAWPYPVYDRAFTHLLTGAFDLALADYRKTLELSPRGFFVAAEAVDMLTREAAGEFPRGLYAAFIMLEQMPPEQQRSIVEQTVEKFPSHAPAWNAYANFLEAPEARLAAIERGLAARPDDHTRGLLLVGKALTLSAQGRRDEARAILQPLVVNRREALGTYALAMLALAAMARQSASEQDSRT